MPKVSELAGEERATFAASIREACFHLVSSWDAMREAEGQLDCDVETEHISGMASNLNVPEDAYEMDDVTIMEALATSLDEDEEGDDDPAIDPDTARLGQRLFQSRNEGTKE